MPPLTPSPLDALIPGLIAILKQSGWDNRWNAAVAIGVYVVWTAVSLFTGLRAVEGEVTPEVFISSLVTAMLTGFVSYQLVWRNFGEATLEAKTSIVKGPESDPVIEDDPVDTGSNG
jgi:hypothetical protein